MKKGMQNKRYRRTEEAIIEVLLREKEMPSTGELARKACISRSTLYRHHRAIPGIVPDYEKGVLNIYGRVVKKMLKQKKMNLKNVYLQTLIFIEKNWRVFEILFKYSGDRVVERMVMKLEDKVRKACYLPRSAGKMMKIYAKEVAGVVEEWGMKGFLEEDIGEVLKKIMYLTETIKMRLGNLR